ncbi:MAG: hypothetical protein ACI9TH_002999 [Kiritimatiellia bacterium]|jgi:hypothetical protein
MNEFDKQLDPSNVQAQEDLAISLFRLVKLGESDQPRESLLAWMEEAVAICQRLTTLDPKNTRYGSNRRFIHARLNELKWAVSLFRQHRFLDHRAVFLAHREHGESLNLIQVARI